MNIFEIIFTFSLFTGILVANDYSLGSSKNLGNSAEKSINANQATESKISKNLRKSKTKTKSKEKQKTVELTTFEAANILYQLEDLENANIYPFNVCKVLTNPKLPENFGITSEEADGIYNPTYAELLNKAAQSNAPLSTILDRQDIYRLKDYLNCLGYYGAITAQALRTGKLSKKITDRQIKRQYNRFKHNLAKAKCRFSGSIDTINCRNIFIKLSYDPTLEMNGVKLFDTNTHTFYAYTSTIRKSITYSTRLALEMQKSKEKGYSDTTALSTSVSKKATSNLEQNSKAEFSMRDWLKFNN